MAANGKFKASLEHDPLSGDVYAKANGAFLGGRILEGRVQVDVVHVPPSRPPGLASTLFKMVAEKANQYDAHVLTADVQSSSELALWFSSFGIENISFVERHGDREVELPITVEAALQSADLYHDRVVVQGLPGNPEAYPGLRVKVALARPALNGAGIDLSLNAL